MAELPVDPEHPWPTSLPIVDAFINVDTKRCESEGSIVLSDVLPEFFRLPVSAAKEGHEFGGWLREERDLDFAMIAACAEAGVA